MLYWHLMRGMRLLTRNFKCDVNWRYFKLHVFLTLRDFIGQNRNCEIEIEIVKCDKNYYNLSLKSTLIIVHKCRFV
jgi:hypothetical protein